MGEATPGSYIDRSLAVLEERQERLRIAEAELEVRQSHIQLLREDLEFRQSLAAEERWFKCGVQDGRAGLDKIPGPLKGYEAVSYNVGYLHGQTARAEWNTAQALELMGKLLTVKTHSMELAAIERYVHRLMPIDWRPGDIVPPVTTKSPEPEGGE